MQGLYKKGTRLRQILKYIECFGVMFQDNEQLFHSGR